MADIFGYNRSGSTDIFTSEKSRLSISGVSGADSLIQNWQLNYQQQIQPIYEIGSSRVYWLKANPVGSGSISKIVGSGVLRMGTSLCDTSGTSITIRAGGSCKGGSVNISCSGVVVTSVGFQSSAQTPIVTQNLGFMFASLKY